MILKIKSRIHISPRQLPKQFLNIFLLILPFQYLLSSTVSGISPIIAKCINFADEGVFLIFACLLLVSVFLSRRTLELKIYPFTLYIFLFVIVAIFSLVINAVGLLQGCSGIFEVLKNILVLYVFASLGYSKDELIKLIKQLITVGVILGVFSVISETLALINGWGIGRFVLPEKRMGLYRDFSLTGQGTWNYLAIYLTLLFFLANYVIKYKIRRQMSLFALFAGIILTLSRQGWASFGMMGILLNKKLRILALILILLAGWLLVTKIDEFNPKYYFRGFTYLKSFEILQDSPLLGAGPGMFGSTTASIWDSPYYKHWPREFRRMVLSMRSIDTFWASIWGEFGILGFSAFVAIWISLYYYLKKIDAKIRQKDFMFYNVGKTLRYFIIALAILCFASGLNMAFVTFTYFALVGMYISASSNLLAAYSEK